MRNLRLAFPQLGLIAATRGMIGFGAGLLVADRLKRGRRKSIGWTLLSVGALSTIPLGLMLFRQNRGDRRRIVTMAD